MQNRHPPVEAAIRVNFRVAVAVNPLLAADLKRFTLGKSRHARLLTLAMLGLVSEKRGLDGDQRPPIFGGLDTINPQPSGSHLNTRLADQDFVEIGD